MLGQWLRAWVNGCSLSNGKGQSIVEITLITPLLLVALYVPFDFGVGLFTAHLTQNAVREAARIAVTTKNPFDNPAGDAIKDEAWNKLPAMLQLPRTVTVTYYASPPNSNCLESVEVRAQGTYNFFLYQVLRFFGFTVSNSIQINRATRMWYQFQPVSNSGSCPTPTVTRTRTT